MNLICELPFQAKKLKLLFLTEEQMGMNKLLAASRV